MPYTNRMIIDGGGCCFTCYKPMSSLFRPITCFRIYEKGEKICVSTHPSNQHKSRFIQNKVCNQQEPLHIAEYMKKEKMFSA
jgi:hypothetical protein